MADDILYANRDKQRGLPETSWVRWLLLSGLKCTIGYGYGLRYFRALIWVMVFVIIGTSLLRLKSKEDQDGKKLGFWYSLDMLLPVIKLRETHYKLDLQNQLVRRYFYVHKIIGYILIFFVLAGLTGLTE